jgi:protein involved in temperature-dependent protein secretion
VTARTIPDPGFAGDHGGPGEALTAALAAYADGTGSQVDALAAVRGSRLLVPVVAVLGEVEVDQLGRAHEKTSDMATVLLQGADGRMALLAFSGMPSLQAWDPEARPVPVTARTAAQAALQDGAEAIVVDVAGPAAFVVEGGDLDGLAHGWALVRVGDRSAWVAPQDEPGE